VKLDEIPKSDLSVSSKMIEITEENEEKVKKEIEKEKNELSVSVNSNSKLYECMKDLSNVGIIKKLIDNSGSTKLIIILILIFMFVILIFSSLFSIGLECIGVLDELYSLSLH
jgi:hypothetical protein